MMPAPEPQITRAAAAQVVEALRAFMYGDPGDDESGDEDVRVNGLDERNTARFLSDYPQPAPDAGDVEAVE